MSSRFVPRQQLARESIERLLAAIHPGERLPSEEQLAKQLGISRPTIRSALSALEQEGLVLRRHGVGTFANIPHPVMDASLLVLNSVADIVRNNGYEPSVTDIRMMPVILPEGVCEELSVPLGTPGHRVTRTILADKQPAVFLVDYLPEKVAGVFVDLSVFSDKMMPALAKLGVPIAYAQTHLSIRRADEEAAAALRVSPGDAVLFLAQVAYTAGHIPVISSIGYHKEGIVTYTLTRHTPASGREEP